MVDVDSFFGMVIQQSALDAQYPGGAAALRNKIGSGELTEGLFYLCSMDGHDGVFDTIIKELRQHGLNADHHDPDCVYVNTFLYKVQAPRHWLDIETDEHDRQWMSVSPSEKK